MVRGSAVGGVIVVVGMRISPISSNVRITGPQMVELLWED